MVATQGRPLIEFLGMDEWPSVSLIICTHRAPNPQTLERILPLVNRRPWKYSIRYGDAWIARARSVAASQWYLNTQDDVFVMLDDDIVFEPADIERLVLECADTGGVVCGDYPVHNGEYMAAVRKPNARTTRAATKGDLLVEVDYAPAGCMAVNRKVPTRLIEDLPLCHASLPIRYWPFFIPFLEDMTEIGGDIIPLSEDFAFTKRVKNAGLPVWLDTNVKLGHMSQIMITEKNMAAIFAASDLKW